MNKLLTLSTILLLSVSCGKYDPQGDIAALHDKVNKVDNKVDNTDSKLAELDRRLDTFILRVDENTNAISDIEIDLAQLNANVNDILDDVRVVNVFSPCENSFGVPSDEVLLELSDGSIMGYFEDGSKRYLSILDSGMYRTTDRVACRFTVD